MKISNIVSGIKRPDIAINYFINRNVAIEKIANRLAERSYDSYEKTVKYNQKNSKHALYFDLCKRILTDSISDENIKNAFFKNFDSLKESEIKEALKEKPTKSRLIGHDSPKNAYTMIGLMRMENLQYCVESVLKNNTEGDLIECGVWRGGACIFMKLILDKYDNHSKKIICADSFEGLPPPNIEKFPDDNGTKLHEEEYLKVGLEDVKNNFRKFGALDDNVIFIKGFFENTLKDAPITSLSVLRLDGDMYGSTWQILENMYPKLITDGFCIVDDYFLEPCKKAIENYRNKENITQLKIPIDYASIYWKK